MKVVGEMRRNAHTIEMSFPTPNDAATTTLTGEDVVVMSRMDVSPIIIGVDGATTTIHTVTDMKSAVVVTTMTPTTVSHGLLIPDPTEIDTKIPVT